MRCAIWYHFYNLKNVKNTHGGVLILVTLFHGCLSRFFNCTNGTKSRNASHIAYVKPCFHSRVLFNIAQEAFFSFLQN